MTITDFKKKRKEKELPPYHFALVHPACIYPNPHAPRKSTHKETADDLTDSIRQNGILTPLIARILHDDGWTVDRYELIDGQRRLTAAKALSLPAVPLIIWDDIERKRAYEMSLILHTQHKHLNIFEMADALELYIRREGYTCEKAAEALSISVSELSLKLSILDLSAVERAIICENGLTERHARALLRVKQPTYRLFALNTVIERGLNVTETENFLDTFLAAPEKHLLSEVFSSEDQTTCEKSFSPTRKAVFRDARLFINTLDRAVATGQASGIPLKAQKNQNDEGVEYTIHIGKM